MENQSMQDKIKYLVLEYVQDGEKKSINQILDFLFQNNISFESFESATDILKSILYDLQTENEGFKNSEDEFYFMESTEKSDINENENTENLEKNINSEKCDIKLEIETNQNKKLCHTKKENEQSKYDFSDFETIYEPQILTVFENGSFVLNSSLLIQFPEKQAEIKLKRDCSQIALLLNGSKKIKLGKNGRSKKYYILNRLKEQNKKFPVYYIGKWNENEKFWMGDITDSKP